MDPKRQDQQPPADQPPVNPPVDDQAPPPPPDPKFGLWKDGQPPPDPAAPQPPNGDGQPPAPTPAPAQPELTEQQQRAWDEMNRRDAALAQRETENARFARAQRLIGEGKHAEAAQHLGMDPNTIIAQSWGEDMVPPQPAAPEPGSSDEVAQLREMIKAQGEQIEKLSTGVSSYQSQVNIQQVLGRRPDLEMVQAIARDEGTRFAEGIQRYAESEQERTGIRPNPEELLERANEYLLEHYCENHQKMIGLKSVADRLGNQATPQPPAPTPAPPPQQRSQQAAPQAQANEPTLTNDLNSEPPETPQRPRTHEERRKAFLSVMRTQGWKSE